MEKVTKPKVKSLATGNKLTAKQMQADAGDLLPKHLANMESILFVQEGECILKINDEDKVLKQGDALIVPPEIIHQIKAKTRFKGVHFMPKEIKFQFFLNKKTKYILLGAFKNRRTINTIRNFKTK